MPYYLLQHWTESNVNPSNAKTFDKLSLEKQNLGSLLNTISPNQQGKR